LLPSISMPNEPIIVRASSEPSNHRPRTKESSLARLRLPATAAGVAVVAFAIAGAACDSSKPFGPKATPTAAEVAQTICSKAYLCCSATQLMSNQTAGTSQAECESKTAMSYQNEIVAVSASEEKGRAIYEPQRLMACLTTIRTSSCADLSTTNHVAGIPECATFATPLVTAGGACGHDWECVDGWCEHAPMTSGDGSCRALVGEGQDCTIDHCAKGTSCSGATKTCVALHAVGATCASAATCASGVCDGVTGTCGPPAGGACFYSTGCHVGGGEPGAGVLALAAVAALLVLHRSRARR